MGCGASGLARSPSPPAAPVREEGQDPAPAAAAPGKPSLTARSGAGDEVETEALGVAVLTARGSGEAPQAPPSGPTGGTAATQSAPEQPAQEPEKGTAKNPTLLALGVGALWSVQDGPANSRVADQASVGHRAVDQVVTARTAREEGSDRDAAAEARADPPAPLAPRGGVRTAKLQQGRERRQAPQLRINIATTVPAYMSAPQDEDRRPRPYSGLTGPLRLQGRGGPGPRRGGVEPSYDSQESSDGAPGAREGRGAASIDGADGIDGIEGIEGIDLLKGSSGLVGLVARGGAGGLASPELHGDEEGGSFAGGPGYNRECALTPIYGARRHSGAGFGSAVGGAGGALTPSDPATPVASSQRRDSDVPQLSGFADTLGAAGVLEGSEYFPDKVVNPRHANRRRMSTTARQGGLAAGRGAHEELARSVFDSGGLEGSEDDPNAPSMMAAMYAQGDAGEVDAVGAPGAAGAARAGGPSGSSAAAQNTRTGLSGLLAFTPARPARGQGRFDVLPPSELLASDGAGKAAQAARELAQGAGQASTQNLSSLMDRSAQPDGPGSYSFRGRADSGEQLEDLILDRSDTGLGRSGARQSDRSLTTNVECYDGLIRDEAELNAILYDSRYYYDAGDVQVRGRREESPEGASGSTSESTRASGADSARGPRGHQKPAAQRHRRQATEEAISVFGAGATEAGMMFQKVAAPVPGGEHGGREGRGDLPPRPLGTGGDDWSLGPRW